jgi:hypothetical protein
LWRLLKGLGLALMMPGCSTAKMYQCAINLLPNNGPVPPKERVTDVLVFFLNASKRSASAGMSTGAGKRKLASMQYCA